MFREAGDGSEMGTALATEQVLLRLVVVVTHVVVALVVWVLVGLIVDTELVELLLVDVVVVELVVREVNLLLEVLELDPTFDVVDDTTICPGQRDEF